MATEEQVLKDEKITKPKSKYPSFTENLREYFYDYSNKTSMHGIRYLGEKERSLTERLIWLIILTISLSLCTSSIVQTYIKWKTSPVIVSFAKSPTPVWQVPFPAITMCPETKVRQSIFNYTDAYHKYKENPRNMSTEELKHFEQASLVCDSHLHTSGNPTIAYDTIEYIARVAPEFSWQCKWINQNTSCVKLVTPTITEEGVCYTFNMLNRDELFTNVVYLSDRFHEGIFFQHNNSASKWNLESGYRKNAEVGAFPRRAMASGQKGCFSLVMHLYEQDLDYICKGPIQGFKILLHNPVEIPRPSQNYFRAPLNQEIVVSIDLDILTTSEGLRDYDPNVRQCYFASERQLKFFRIYTQRNCEVECLTNYTTLKCGCVPYHMPHEKATEICGTGSTICVRESKVEMLAREIKADMKRFHSKDYSNDEGRCNCLPSCTSIKYNAELSHADFNWKEVMMAYKENLSEYLGVQMTRVSFFFKEQQFFVSERNELYGTVDLLDNCGGLLGLFVGFSLLSVIEIFYYLTLRLLCNIKMHGRHFWSASPKLLNDERSKHDN